MSALADGPTHLDGIPRCDDVDAMFGALERLGVGVRRQGKSARLTPPTRPFPTDIVLDLGMSGVSLRLLLAHARIANLDDAIHRPPATPPPTERRSTRVAADDRLQDRVDAGGPPADHRDRARRPPLRKDDVGHQPSTSQYLSGLMLSAPGLPAGLTITLVGERTSASYLDVTTTEMAKPRRSGPDARLRHGRSSRRATTEVATS